MCYKAGMTKFEDIKTAITKLPDDERARLRDWLLELDAQRFDQQIEADAAAGKLNKLMDGARANHVAGRSTEL